MAVRDSHDSLRAYMRNYINARYRRIMDEIIQYLGGKCSRCDSKERLQTDHKDRTTKLFNISTGIQNVSKKKLWEEIEKCQLLCKSCHWEKGIEMGDIKQSTHGSPGMYDKRRHNCKCDICKEGNNKRSREWKCKKRLKFLESMRTVSV